MRCDNIYVDYEDYDNLNDLYETQTDFYNAVSTLVSAYDFSFLSSDTTLVNKIKAFVNILANPIYNEYYDDKVAYEESDVFLKRLINSVARKVNNWYVHHKLEEGLMNNASLDNYIKNGGTHSETNENASTGSAVIQKSASTPTGITHNASSEGVDMELSHSSSTDTTSLDVDDGYDDKYTNFVGKTNGLHRNEVDRDTDITRTSNYGLALEIADKIPYSYINDVLREVSQHFIQVY